MVKQILGAIEFSDQEIRLVVGEYFNTRFNVIKVDSIPCRGIIDCTITNKDEVKKCINEIVERNSDRIGAHIQRLILLIPSVNFKRYPLKVNVQIDDGVVSVNDVNRAIKKAMRTIIDSNIMIINAVCVKFTCNGISSRRIPVGEYAEELAVDIDLLCADRSITFDYVSLLEECDIEVMDIMLDMYAVCKEAALFEKTVNHNIILLKIDYQTTTLALLSKGKLANCEILYNGLGSIVNPVYDKYHISMNVIERLVKYNAHFDSEEASQDAIYAWKTNDGQSNTINEEDLSDIILEPTKKLVDEIKEACRPILENGQTDIMIVGEGAKMDALVQMIGEVTGTVTKTYVPETIGIRDSAYVAILGSIYGYRDRQYVDQEVLSSINLLEFNELVDKKTIDSEGETLTTRIRSLFEPSKREEK